MSSSLSTARPLPRWLMLLGSLGIGFHLLAVLVMVIASRSGPWPSPYGPSNQEPPPFAASINDFTMRFYLQPLQLAHNYHFVSNRTDVSSVRFEVRLKDGVDVKTLQFPEENANFWVRHRESLLAQGLGDDQPVQASSPNTIPAPGQEVERVQIWDDDKGGRNVFLHSVPVTSLSQNRPRNGPSAWSQLLAKSYVRYLMRRHGAESAELIRHSREPIPPVVVLLPQDRWPRDLFNEMVADFTERQP